MLDLLLTNSESLVSNISILQDKYICNSDHYTISFEIKTNVKHKKVPNRKILNFKKANWDGINHDLSHIQWNAYIDCTEPEIFVYLGMLHSTPSQTKALKNLT